MEARRTLATFVPFWAWALMAPGIAAAVLGVAGLSNPASAARLWPALANPAVCLLLVGAYFLTCIPAGGYVIAYWITITRAKKP